MGASFIVEQFEKLIQEQGYNAHWSQAVVCHCLTDGQPDFHCAYCSGRGWRYLPPVLIKGVTTSFSGSRDLQITGLREPGTAYITPQNGVIMGYQDRVEFIDIICKHSQVVTMEEYETSATYRPIHKVLFVMNKDLVYEENIDFRIVADKHHLQWINKDTKPAKGTKISMLYMTTPSYLVKDLTHELRSTQEQRGKNTPYTIELPKQYLIKRENFIYGHTMNAKNEEQFYSSEPVDGSEEFTYG